VAFSLHCHLSLPPQLHSRHKNSITVNALASVVEQHSTQVYYAPLANADVYMDDIIGIYQPASMSKQEFASQILHTIDSSSPRTNPSPPHYQAFVWRYSLPNNIKSHLISATNPTGTITNSDLELAPLNIRTFCHTSKTFITSAY
jgi:hypothetical protein